MRSVIEQREPRTRGVAKIDNVQRSGFLIKIVAITARIECEERAEQKADRRLVRHDQNILARVLVDKFDQCRQRARSHSQTAFAAERLCVSHPLRTLHGALRRARSAVGGNPRAGDRLPSLARARMMRAEARAA